MNLYIFILIYSAVYAEGFVAKIIRTQINSSYWDNVLSKEQDDNGLDVFLRKRIGNHQWELTARVWPKTIDVLRNSKIKYKVLTDDIPIAVNSSTHASDNGRRSGILRNSISFEEYLTYDEILKYLENLPQQSLTYRNVSVISIGKTVQNRDINMVKIEHANASDIMFFDAGIHAREWLAVMSGLYLITQLVKAKETSSISKMNWFIIPCLNPDGYINSYKHKRMHRKNMNTKNCPKDCGACGVDLNRNFGYKYGVSGSSTNPCSEIYRGERAFSEPESRALRDVLIKHVQNIKLYLSIHSYANYILYPWGYTGQLCTDYKDLQTAAIFAAKAIRKNSKIGTRYRVGGAGAALGVGAGGSDDYAKFLGIKYAFTMEVQQGGSIGFNPPKSLIKYFTAENFAGLTTMAEYVINPKLYPNKINKHHVMHIVPTTTYTIVIYYFIL